jgi:hypothetical protein
MSAPTLTRPVPADMPDDWSMHGSHVYARHGLRVTITDGNGRLRYDRTWTTVAQAIADYDQRSH